MTKIYALLLTCTLTLILIPEALAQNSTLISEHGKWRAYSFSENGQKVCYMISEPVTDAGNYTKRGDIAAMITHWPAQGQKNVFSYAAGYPYKKGSEVSVSISSKSYNLFTQGEMAWAPDVSTDNKLISAIKRGATMVIKGTSTRGTLTTDTYSLKGSTAAYNAISKACGVK